MSRALVTTCLAVMLGASRDAPGQSATVTTVNAQHLTGRIVSWQLGKPLEIQSEANEPLRLESRDLDRLELAAPTTPGRLGSWRIALQDGSLWRTDIAGGDEQRLFVTTKELGGPYRIPLDEIAFVAKQDNEKTPPANDEDTVVLDSGMILRGAVSGISTQGLNLSADRQERPIAWKSVRVLVPARTARPAKPGLTALIYLGNAMRLRATALTWTKDVVEIVGVADIRLSLNPSLISLVEIDGGRRTWLSELPPKSYESIPFMSKRWPLRMDQNVMGGPLSISGAAYRHGLGMHSACKTTWDLGKNYQRFLAAVGIDDSAGSLADADVIVHLDGRVVAEFRHLAAGQPARPIDLNVEGAGELTVEVGFGKTGHVQDRVDLVNAALIAK